MTGPPDPPRPASKPPVDRDDEVAALHERVDSLEAMVEALQDAIYRQSVHMDGRIDDLLRRIDPGELARSMSADARKRGL
jgi:hypothetical protein